MASALSARRWAFLLAILSQLAGMGLAQEVSSDSYTFNQPIPVTIRMSNNNVFQGMLMGVNQTGVSVLTPQGKLTEFAHKKMKSVRSADGSIFFQPAKDDIGELIGKLNTLSPNNKAAAPGQANAGSGPNAAMPMAQPNAAHSQPATTTTAMPAPHAQMSTPSYTPPAQTTSSYTPPAHSMSSYTPPYSPPAMPPMQAHAPSMAPSMTMPPQPPQMQMMWEYQCSKCRHKFTTTVQMTPGQSCPKCGTKWQYINGQGAPPVRERPAILHPKVLGTIIGIFIAMAGGVLVAIKKANG